jgi:hypothetical protein
MWGCFPVAHLISGLGHKKTSIREIRSFFSGFFLPTQRAQWAHLQRKSSYPLFSLLFLFSWVSCFPATSSGPLSFPDPVRSRRGQPLTFNFGGLGAAALRLSSPTTKNS